MLKELDVNELKVGMYVHDLGRSWLNHPFVSASFKLESKQQIRQMQDAGINRIIIDTDKSEVADQPTRQTSARMEAQPGAASSEEPVGVSLEQELGKASQIKNEASKVVARVMEDIRKGKKIQVKSLNPVVEDIVTSIFRNQNALIGLMRIRRTDKYTYEHSVSMSVLLTAFAQHLGMSEEDMVQVGIGGLLMDIGKVKIPLGILSKPGKLNPQELQLMHHHVEYGKEILAGIPDIPQIALDIVRDHHERLDGSGYPEAKKGNEISFHGMMAAIVDVYDAISTDRVYRTGISPHTALKMLVDRKNSDFHPELVYHFVHCVGVYPIGTLVQLSDGRFAVVLEPRPPSNAQSPLPKVRVIYDMLSRRHLPPQDLDLGHQEDEKKVTIVGAQEAQKWHIEPERFLDHARV